VAIRTSDWQSLALAVAGSTLLAGSAHAAPVVSLGSAVYVEKAQPGNVRRLEPASQLSRGDRVVTVVTWQKLGGDGGFTVTNPLPRSVYYQRSADDNEEVSADSRAISVASCHSVSACASRTTGTISPPSVCAAMPR
jgi:hypothetical protein